MTRRTRTTAIIVVLTVALAAVTIFVVVPALRHRTLDVAVDRNLYPVKGIDVSHHNGVINFDKVKADSVDFVIIKATDGVGDTDECLARNYAEARAAGLDVGVYHFFRYHRDGHAQARYFISAIDTLQLDLPVIIDLEETDNHTGLENIVPERLRNMVDELHRAGYRVMIYANQREYKDYVAGQFDDVDLWLASSQPPAQNEDNRRLWQHSHRGRVDGIKGHVDLNTFNGTRQQYLRWLQN